jgi:hypothetical protein
LQAARPIHAALQRNRLVIRRARPQPESSQLQVCETRPVRRQPSQKR